MASKSATDGYIYIPAKRRQPIPAGQRANDCTVTVWNGFSDSVYCVYHA